MRFYFQNAQTSRGVTIKGREAVRIKLAPNLHSQEMEYVQYDWCIGCKREALDRCEEWEFIRGREFYLRMCSTCFDLYEGDDIRASIRLALGESEARRRDQEESIERINGGERG